MLLFKSCRRNLTLHGEQGKAFLIRFEKGQNFFVSLSVTRKGTIFFCFFFIVCGRLWLVILVHCQLFCVNYSYNVEQLGK